MGAFSNDEEKAQLINFGTLDFVAMMDAELNEGDLEASEESQATEDFKEQLGEEDNDVLSIKNVLLLRNSLPNDIGLLYSKYYYDDETTAVIQKNGYWYKNAYIKRFANIVFGNI